MTGIACGPWTDPELAEWRRCELPPGAAFDPGDVIEGTWGSRGVRGMDTPPKGVPCVYRLYNRMGLVYVGRSEHIRARLAAHWRDARGKPDVTWWRVEVCRDWDHMVRWEARLIRRFRPRYNTAGVA